MTILIKNWSQHQHFKDRTPPWIKLYRDLLDDPDWHALPGDDAKLLVGLWLVASEDKGRNGALPDARHLAFRLRISESYIRQALTRLSHWLILDDDAAISPRYRDDAPETETETETDAPAGAKPAPAKRKSAKLDFAGFVSACAEAGEKPIPADDPVFAYAEKVGLPAGYVALAWGWFKARYADKRQAGVRGWRQTFRNAVEGNWPRFWYADDAGGWGLTTAGKQAERAQS